MTVKLFCSAIAKFTLGVALIGLLLFLPAGTLHYPQAWLLMVILFIVVIIGIIVFAASNLSFYDKGNPFSGVYASDIMNIRTLVDFAGNTVLVAYFIQRKQQKVQQVLHLL